MQSTAPLSVYIFVLWLLTTAHSEHNSVDSTSQSWSELASSNLLSILRFRTEHLSESSNTWIYHVDHPKPMRDAIVIEPAVIEIRQKNASGGVLRCDYILSAVYEEESSLLGPRSEEPIGWIIVRENLCDFELHDIAEDYSDTILTSPHFTDHFSTGTECYSPHTMQITIERMQLERKNNSSKIIKIMDEPAATSENSVWIKAVSDGKNETESDAMDKIFDLIDRISIITLVASFVAIFYIKAEKDAPPPPLIDIYVDFSCKICTEELIDVVLEPCGHLAVCQSCYRNLRWKKRLDRSYFRSCPICNQDVETHQPLS